MDAMLCVFNRDPASQSAYRQEKQASKRRNAFPIAKDAKEYRAKSAGGVKGLPDALVKRIDALEPYKGGNDLIWALHELNIVDKHRLLLATVLAQDISTVLHDPSLGSWLYIREFISVEDGAEIQPVLLNPEVNVKDQFSFSVSFAEPEIIRSEPIVAVLTELADLVEGIIAVFDDIP